MKEKQKISIFPPINTPCICETPMAHQQALRKPTTPGDVLQYEYLEPLNLKITDLADMLNVHRNTISALVNNNRKLTADMAIRLAKAFDTSVEFWLNLQLNLDIWEAQTDARMQEELSRVKTAAEILAARKTDIA